MNVRGLVVLALLLSVAVPAALAKDKGDVYFGYTRVGANLYGPYTSGMNGWQGAAHYKPLPFLGVEGDVTHYSQSPHGYSSSVTLVMFGPRVTLHAAGFSVFAHGLGGFSHQSQTVTTFPQISFDAGSYAFGAGADIPILLKLKLRATGDYLGNTKAPSSQYSPAHYRIGVGVAYHF